MGLIFESSAEGRRSMEKEFKELLKFASGMRLQGMAKGGLKMTDDKGAET